MAELLEAEALAALEDAEADSIAEALDTAALAADEAAGAAGRQDARPRRRGQRPRRPHETVRTAASGETSESPNGSEPPEHAAGRRRTRRPAWIRTCPETDGTADVVTRESDPGPGGGPEDRRLDRTIGRDLGGWADRSADPSSRRRHAVPDPAGFRFHDLAHRHLRPGRAAGHGRGGVSRRGARAAGFLSRTRCVQPAGKRDAPRRARRAARPARGASATARGRGSVRG